MVEDRRALQVLVGRLEGVRRIFNGEREVADQAGLFAPRIDKVPLKSQPVAETQLPPEQVPPKLIQINPLSIQTDPAPVATKDAINEENLSIRELMELRRKQLR